MKDIHTHLDEWIAAALLHDLTPSEQGTFDRHLEQNAEARARYHEAKTMSTLLENTLSPQRPSPNFESRMVSGFRERMDGARQSWVELAVFWLPRPVAYIPATAIVLIGLVNLGAHLTKESRGAFTTAVAAVAAYGALDQASNGTAGILPAEGGAQGTVRINQKLDEIVLPRLDLHDATVQQAIDFLQQQAAALDTTESDPARRGVSINLQVPPDAPEANAPITLAITDIPLRAAMEYVAKAVNLKIKVGSLAVAMVPITENTDVLVTKEYKVPPGFLGVPPGTGAPEAPAVAARSNAKDFLVANGMEFPTGASATYLPESNKLVIRNTEANLDLLDTLVDASVAEPKASDGKLSVPEKVPMLGDIPVAGRLFKEGVAESASAPASGPVAATYGYDLASAPSVTTKSGQLAQVRVAETLNYPVSPTAAPVTAGNRTAAISPQAMDGLLAADASRAPQLAANKDMAKQAEERKSDDSAQRRNLNFEKAEKPAQAVTDPTVVDNRKLVRNASLDLEVKNYDAALDSITAIAAGNSGYVATKNSARLANGKMSGTIVLKVLPDRLDAALLQIRGLGELKNQSLSTRDVTKEYFDTDARLRNARKMEDRLLDLLGTMKGKISELLQVEKELARVREQIEQMQGELKVYDSLVQYATITISLREKDLNEAAAYLLKENVNLSLFAGDVEKAYEAARREADGGKAQILQSRVVKEDSGRVTAVMELLIAPEDADGLIGRIKGLGRVQNYNKQDERIAQDGSANLNTSKIDRDKVRLSLSVLPDDESRKEIRLVVQTKKVENAFEEAKTAAANQGATVVTSGLSVAQGADGKSANLTVRTPGKNQAELLEAFKKLGLVSQFTVQRDDAGHADPNEPVLITLALTNASQPVQVTRGAILTPQVEQQASHLKQAASAAQGETVTSTFERLPDGTQIANLVFRLPLDKYAGFFEEASRAGKMKDFTVQRQDRAEQNPELSTAEVVLRLYSQGPVVAESNGLMATLRHTLGQGAGALMWSVRMIGVAVAFLAPWAIALVAVVWVGTRVARVRKAGGK